MYIYMLLNKTYMYILYVYIYIYTHIYIYIYIYIVNETYVCLYTFYVNKIWQFETNCNPPINPCSSLSCFLGSGCKAAREGLEKVWNKVLGRRISDCRAKGFQGCLESLMAQ